MLVKATLFKHKPLEFRAPVQYRDQAHHSHQGKSGSVFGDCPNIPGMMRLGYPRLPLCPSALAGPFTHRFCGGAFNFNGVRLLLSGMSSETGAGTAAMYFRVDDIDAAYQSLLAAGIEFEQGPQMIHRDENGTFGPAGSEEWMAFFKDPDGNTLALATCKTQ